MKKLTFAITREIKRNAGFTLQECQGFGEFLQALLRPTAFDTYTLILPYTMNVSPKTLVGALMVFVVQFYVASLERQQDPFQGPEQGSLPHHPNPSTVIPSPKLF